MNAFSSTIRRLAVLVGLVTLLGLSAPAQAQTANCTTGSAEVNLDINNVRAKLYNIGGLFWRGSGAQYIVPKNSGLVSIFASGIWVGGQVDGQLRFAGSTYSPWEYWPGPLTANGTVTRETCQAFDKFWNVTIGDIRAYNNTGVATSDLAGWPVAYGAPYFVDTNGNGRRDPTLDEDGDGVFDEPRIEHDINDPEYGSKQLDLAAGERPDIIGDQGIWWVMNDAGNSHDWGETEAIGLEVRAHAFAFSTADALNNATFYRYQFVYRGQEEMTDTYIGIFSDPDLGNFNDDYVGSDPELGLGFVYNGDNTDDGGGGYGAFPPALGYDFFQGPLVNDDGIDNDDDGETDEDDERLAIEKFFYFTNGGTVTSDPGNANEAYSYMQGLWKDGTPLKEGGDGYNTNGPVIDFAFPGNPPEFWSEYNSDGNGTANTPADRRFGVSSGPFTFEPGEIQEIVFGIVWSQAVGAATLPQIASVNKLKVDDATLQNAFDADFALPQPPPAVTIDATGLDQEIILEWESETGDNADLFTYDVENPFVPVDVEDRTYTFEGFLIYQFRNESDSEGILINSFDLDNGITNIVDVFVDPSTGEQLTQVVVSGKDNGSDLVTPTTISVSEDAFTQERLRNGTTYYFGVQAYAYNEASNGTRVFLAPMTRVDVKPTKVGPTTPVAATGTGVAGVPGDGNIGGGSVSVTVVNPAITTGDTYRVEFFRQPVLEDMAVAAEATTASGDDSAEDSNAKLLAKSQVQASMAADDFVGINYNIINETTGEVVFDGSEYYANTGQLAPQREDVFRVDGLSFNILGPDPGPLFPGGINAFVEVTGPGGADPCAPDAASRAGCDSIVGMNNIYQSYNGTADYIGYHIGDGPEFSIGNFAPNDYEIRFTDEGGYAVYGFTTDNVHPVPFEVWDIGLTPPGFENDPSDDVRMIPFLFSDNSSSSDRSPECNEQFDYVVDTIFGLGEVTPRVYMYYPKEGQTYEDFAAAAQADLAGDPDNCAVSAAAYGVADTGRGRPIQRFVMEQSGSRGINDLSGTVIRFYSTDPNQPGDTFAVPTADVQAVTPDARTAEDVEALLDLMAITPNPYRGFSGYESSGNETVARFVNLPAQATIRIFTLSGTLVRQIEKANPATASIDWDLRTAAGLPVASGMYLIHVEARDASGAVLGERVLKFGVVQRRTQLDVL